MSAKKEALQLRNAKNKTAIALYIKKAVLSTGWLGLLALLGVVGGMDTGRIDVLPGIVCSVILLVLSTLALRKAGWFR